jgi:hypothetical protein
MQVLLSFRGSTRRLLIRDINGKINKYCEKKCVERLLGGSSLGRVREVL